MESAAVGRGQVDPGPLLGPVSWYATVQVCRCACVPVCRRSRWCTDIPACNISVVLCVGYNYPMVSFSSSYVCLRLPSGFPDGFVMISYGFLTSSYCLSMVSYVFLSVRMFVWFSCEFPSEFLWFPVVFLELFFVYDFEWFFDDCPRVFHFPMLAQWFSYNLHDFFNGFPMIRIAFLSWCYTFLWIWYDSATIFLWFSFRFP